MILYFRRMLYEIIAPLFIHLMFTLTNTLRNFTITLGIKSCLKKEMP